MFMQKYARAWGINSGVWYSTGPVFSYKLRYIVGFWLVELAISTNQKPTIYRNLYENTAPGTLCKRSIVTIIVEL